MPRLFPRLALYFVIVASMLCLSRSTTAQDSDRDLRWLEGANIKVNHDLTSELQNEQSCAINPTNPDNVIAVWRDFRLGYRRIGVGTTFNGGANWSDSLLVGTTRYPRASDPVMSYTADGDILACVLSLTVDQSVSAIHVYRSTNGGTSWSTPVAAVDVFGAQGFEDKQWINVDRTNSPYRNRVYIPWARFGVTTDIWLTHSETPSSYSDPVVVSDVSSVQWPTVAIGPDGTVYVAWVSYDLNCIAFDKSTDGGDSWGEDVTVTLIAVTNTTLNGGILTFAFPAMDVDISGGVFNGNIYVAYCDMAADGELDFYIRRSTNQGTVWTSPVRINDDPVGNNVDQFHPWLVVDESGILTACWFDRRLDPSNYNWDFYVAHSFDAGASWTSNRRISEVSSSPANALGREAIQYAGDEAENGLPIISGQDVLRSPRAGLIGEYSGLAVRSGIAQVVFTDTRNGNQDTYSARITVGFSAPPLLLPEADLTTNESRPTFVWGKTGATPAEIAQFPGTLVQPLHYVLQIDDDSLFGSVDVTDSNLTATSREIVSGLADGIWFWRVYALNDSGRSTGFAQPFRRFTIDTQSPGMPTILSPEADSFVDAGSQVYQWTAVTKDDKASPVTYQLEVSMDSSFVVPGIAVAGIMSNSYANTTPLLAGMTYYCRVKATDAADNTSGFTPARRFHTRVAYICGDADHSGAVDISDAVYLIAYIFSGGSAPVPPEAGDPDCSGAVDISDVVFLISFIFGGGAAPCSSC